MNTGHCVHFASQGSMELNSLSILHLSNNKLTSVSIYYRLAIDNAVICWFVLGDPQPDYYTGEGCTVPWGGRNGFGKRVAAGVYFYQLRADDVPSLRKMVILKRLRSALKSKRSDSMSDQKLLIGIGFFLFCQQAMVTSCRSTKKVRISNSIH